ncbi:T9SS type A sorting domain-containing protein [Chryseobacterium sp. KMC2]|uniref:T9SS type A sorting domain-containing protein n=2 Tax=unclassified Chryseobacterium TaxID=2593645 RepID=UPI0019236311|nr:T9SS type A sorting domain-containing protein [Chryseobacterium sp. KMC2]MBL3547281.1 T9SS type A sorting domain-containing protein [Chryseobacterium sp. KMC2]
MKKLLFPCFLLLGTIANAQEYNTSQNFDNALTGVYYFGGGGVTTNTNSCSGTLSYAKTYTNSAPEGGVYISPSDLNQINNGKAVTVTFRVKKTGAMSGKLLLFTRVKTGNTWENAVYYAINGSDINPLNPNVTSSTLDCVTFAGTIPEGALAVGTEYGIGIDFYKTSSGSGGLTIDDVNIVQNTSNLSVSEVTKEQSLLYPTPFHDVIKISNLKNVKSVTVNDAVGRQMKSFLPNNELSLTNLKDGVYFVNLHMEDGSIKTYKTFKK